jgi:hypothetical protein
LETALRVSVFPDDPGYKNFGGTFDVYLDDEKLTNVYTADDDTGEIVVVDNDEWLGSGVTIFKTKYGKVTIVPK